jgi:hypothetical protein
LAVRLSPRNLHVDDGLLNVPLCLADHTNRLIGLALGGDATLTGFLL